MPSGDTRAAPRPPIKPATRTAPWSLENPLIRRLLDVGLLVGAALIINVLTWPLADVAPTIGLDGSWAIGLHLAASQHLHYGSEIGFTYGPLGFLVIPKLVTSTTGVLAFSASFLLRTGVVAALLVSSRRAFRSFVVALPVTYVIAALLLEFVEYAGLLVLLVALLMIQRPLEGRAGEIAAAALGAGSAVMLLVKFNAGILGVVCFLAAAAFQGTGWRRSAALWGAGLGATFLALWLATGNRIVDIPSWFSWSTSITSGYSGGTMYEQVGVERTWEYSAYLAAAVVLVALAVVNGRGGPRARQLAVAGVLAFGLWIYFKHGFVRHDAHVVFSFSVLAALAVAVAWKNNLLRLAAIGLVVAASVFVVQSAHIGTGPILSPEGKPGAILEQAQVVFDGGERRRAIDAYTATVRQQLGVDQRIVDAIGDRGVHVSPHEVSAVWAYGLRWEPIPHFQSFSTWSHGIDEVNREHLLGEDAPPVVLGQNVGRFDVHSPLWEAPGENLALMCGYRPGAVADPWTLLERTGDRCRPPRSLGRATLRRDLPAPLPAVGKRDVLYARIDWGPGLLGRLRALVFKPSRMPEFRLMEPGRNTRVRIPASLLEGPLILRAPMTPATPPRTARYLAAEDWVLRYPDEVAVEYFATTLD